MSIDRNPTLKFASTTHKQPAKTLITKFIKLFMVAQNRTNIQVNHHPRSINLPPPNIQVTRHRRIINLRRTTAIRAMLISHRPRQPKHTCWKSSIQHTTMICTRLIMNLCTWCPSKVVWWELPTWRFSMRPSPTFTDATKDFIDIFSTNRHCFDFRGLSFLYPILIYVINLRTQSMKIHSRSNERCLPMNRRCTAMSWIWKEKINIVDCWLLLSLTNPQKKMRESEK